MLYLYLSWNLVIASATSLHQLSRVYSEYSKAAVSELNYQESLRRLTGWRAPPWRGSRPRSCRPCPGCRGPRRVPSCQTRPCIAWYAWHCHVLQRLTCTSPQLSGCAPREQSRTKAGILAKFSLERKKYNLLRKIYAFKPVETLPRTTTLYSDFSVTLTLLMLWSFRAFEPGVLRLNTQD